MEQIDNRLTVGGISCGIGNLLGFKQEGFNVLFLEDERDILSEGKETWKHNFPGIALSSEIGVYKHCETDVLISSPNCAQLSKLGMKRLDRNKLNEFKMDDFDFVKGINNLLKRKAKFYVMEYLEAVFEYFEIRFEGLYYKLTKELRPWPKGYRAQVMSLDARHYHVPQLRRRTFLILSEKKYNFIYMSPTPNLDDDLTAGTVFTFLDDARAAGPLLNDESPNHTDKRIEGFKALKPGESYYGGPNNKRLDPNKLCGVITSHRTRHVHPWFPRVLNVRECATIQGFPLDFEFKSSEAINLDLIGKTISPPIARDIAKQIKETIEGYSEQV